LLTAGVDVPLNPQFTAAAAVNAAFWTKCRDINRSWLQFQRTLGMN